MLDFGIIFFKNIKIKMVYCLTYLTKQKNFTNKILSLINSLFGGLAEMMQAALPFCISMLILCIR